MVSLLILWMDYGTLNVTSLRTKTFLGMTQGWFFLAYLEIKSTWSPGSCSQSPGIVFANPASETCQWTRFGVDHISFLAKIRFVVG
jgi:hypothetical protein